MTVYLFYAVLCALAIRYGYIAAVPSKYDPDLEPEEEIMDRRQGAERRRNQVSYAHTNRRFGERRKS